MTERLDRIESLLLSTAERQNEMNASLQQTQTILNQTAQQQAINSTGIDDLLGVVVTHETELQRVLSTIEESNRRFDILREEAIADRAENDRKFNENSRRFDILREEIIADRTESNRRFDESSQHFDAQLSEIRAQGEQIRALLSALANTNGRVSDLEQAS